MPATRGNVELVQYMAEVAFELGQEAWVWMSASGMGWIQAHKLQLRYSMSRYTFPSVVVSLPPLFIDTMRELESQVQDRQVFSP